MTSRLKHLELLKTYNFSVLVEDGGEQFLGKLLLTPEKSTIAITAERSQNRGFSDIGTETKQIICKTADETFLLENLSLFRLESKRAFSDGLGELWIFEIVFEIEFVCFSSFNLITIESVQGFSIHSERINRWIGFTETQRDITASYEGNDPLISRSNIGAENLVEFSETLSNIGNIKVSYNWTMYQNHLEFKAGLFFPPSLSIRFYECQSVLKTKEIYHKIYDFMAFATGSDFVVDRIDIAIGNALSSKTGSLYYSTEKFRPRTKSQKIFWPLGKDLLNTQPHLPLFPTSCFNRYFLLAEPTSKIWKKYSRYKRMANAEERFLGYFRLLERLCKKGGKTHLSEDILSELSKEIELSLTNKAVQRKHTKSFLKGLPRYNSSKYNMEKYIQMFYEQIPRELTDTWKLGKQEVKRICKLRNDISHANDYYTSEEEVLENEKFVEVLLVIAMCSELEIGIDESTRVVNRIDQYQVLTVLEKY